jgi:murein DD-endopeptidase MepM/ murein hydrolase activator NlpD
VTGRGRLVVGASLLALVVTVPVSVQLPAAAPRTATREGQSPAGIAASPVANGVTMKLAARLDTLRHELDAIEAQLAGLPAAVSAIAESVRVADPEVLQTKHELARQADDAQGAALRPSLAAAASAATPSALVRPLQTVNGAMRSKDDYVAALLRALAAAQRQDVSLRSLTDTARLLRSELERRMNDLERLRSDATRAVSLEDGASSILDPVRVEVGRTQELLALAHRADIDLRVESIRLRSLRDALLEQMERAEARGEVLHEAMARVEDFVGNAFPGLVFSAATPVVAGVLHVCPIDQPHSYTDDFGAPRWAGGYHPHQGNDIFAPEGTPIRAPFDGLAVRTPNTLGGRAVTVYGDAGYVYNAHLSAYGKLGQVTTGTIIGYVGNSGDATNSAPHDHFEWHPGNRAAVDPFPYLNAVCLLPSATTNVAQPS